MIYGDEIEKVKVQAMQTQDMQEKLRLKQEDERSKQTRENLNKRFTFALADIHDLPPEEASKQLAVLEATLRSVAPLLSSSDVSRIEGNIQKAKEKLLEPEELKITDPDKETYAAHMEKEILKEIDKKDI